MSCYGLFLLLTLGILRLLGTGTVPELLRLTVCTRTLFACLRVTACVFFFFFFFLAWGLGLSCFHLFHEGSEFPAFRLFRTDG
jgi:hypothetical protein